MYFGQLDTRKLGQQLSLEPCWNKSFDLKSTYKAVSELLLNEVQNIKFHFKI